jgi:ankyrin repeat protein
MDPHKPTVDRAIQQGNLNMVTSLLDSGETVSDESRAINNAARGGHKDVVVHLIDRGFECEVGSAFLIAARMGHTEVAGCLLGRLLQDSDRQQIGMFYEEAMLRTAEKGHLETVRLLIDTHNVNFVRLRVGSDGRAEWWFPLVKKAAEHAASNGHIGVATALVTTLPEASNRDYHLRRYSAEMAA